MNICQFANEKGADQPMHSRSPISAFVVNCLHMINLVSFSFIARVGSFQVQGTNTGFLGMKFIVRLREIALITG